MANKIPKKWRKELRYPCRDTRKTLRMICYISAGVFAIYSIGEKIYKEGFSLELLAFAAGWILFILAVFILLNFLFIMQDYKAVKMIFIWLQEKPDQERIHQSWGYLEERKGAMLSWPVMRDPARAMLIARIMRSAANEGDDQNHEKYSLAQNIALQSIAADQRLAPCLTQPFEEFINDYPKYIDPHDPVTLVFRIFTSELLKGIIVAVLVMLIIFYLIALTVSKA